MKTHDRLPAALMWVLPVLLIIPNVALDITEQYYSVAARIANVALPAGIYLLLMAWSRKAGRTALLLIPVMVLCAFQIVLLYLYGESIIAIDMFLNVVTTNAHEAGELLRNLGEAIAVVCLLYLPPIVVGIVLCACKRYTDHGERKAAAMAGGAMGGVGLVAFIAAFFMPGGYKAERELFPVNVCYNMGMAAYRTEQSVKYYESSAAFHFGTTAVADSMPPVVVLVVGETSRADNWQLNGYERETNPRLSRREGLVSFGKALSESNTTHKSVPLMLSHLGAGMFGDSIYSVKSVISAFGEGGYRTAWLSNQQHNGSLIDFFGNEADVVDFLVDDGHDHHDMELVGALSEFVRDNADRPLFAVLHTYGSHFNYKERYPEDFDFFEPVSDMQADKSNRSQLINAYDNSIVYVDAVLDSIAGVLEFSGRPAAMLYLADHGEDIFDDGRNRFLHASPTPTYWQLHVPMVLWMSPEYISEHPDRYAAARSNADRDVSSSHSAFHTLMSLGDVSAGVYESSSALTDYGYEAPLRMYVNDYNEGVALSRAGLRTPDFECLAKRGIDVGTVCR